MLPVAASKIRPAGTALKVPPAVPVRVTGWGVFRLLQKGEPGYIIDAAGIAFTVIVPLADREPMQGPLVLTV
jgi:hypothetical protein